MNKCPVYSAPTGSVFLRNFDQAVADHIGASLNAEKNCYELSIPGVDSPISINWSNPDQTTVNYVLPAIIINRDAFPYAADRRNSIRHFDYCAGVSGTETVVNGCSGFSEVERKLQAEPTDFQYQIKFFARYRHEAETILACMLRRFPKYGGIKVIDSIGEERIYTVFNDNAATEITELVDVADRVVGYSISFTIEGELDLTDPERIVTVAGVVNRASMQ